jgi:hypothetical protein
MSIPDQRKRYQAFWRKLREIEARWEKRGRTYTPRWPILALDLCGLTCSAKTQAGTPCKQRAIFKNGRCKWHGGLSTGPKTEAGKEQSRINGRKGGRPKKNSKV